MAASHALPPLRTDPEALRAGLLARLRRDPRAWGEERSRWTLAGLRAHDPDVADYSVAGLWRLLRRLAIHWKRGRDHLHSPDPDYDAKLASLAVCRAEVAAAPDRVRLVFLDELTYYRQPTIGWGYAAAGSAEPWAQRTPRFNTPTRVLGALDPTTGQVTAVQGRTLGVAALVPFYAQLCTAAPEVTRWYVVQDNWPVHTHPDLLVALEPQTAPFPWYRPRSWPTEPSPRAVARWGDWALPIQIVPLPTYAPWTNPIEQLWRWLKAEVLHLHPWADDLVALRAAVQAFLDRFAHGSEALLRYVGLPIPP